MMNFDLAGIRKSGLFLTYIQLMAYAVLGTGKKRVIKQQMCKHQ